jgi:hypothetical protein
MEASLLWLSWRCHPHCNGVVIIDVQVSLQSRHLCHHCNNFVALVAMLPLPSSSWCCCPCHDGIITIVIAQAPLQLSQWHHCPCCTGAITNIARLLSPLLHWHHCHYPTDLFALTLHGHCHRCCTDVVTPVELACLRR